MLQSLLFSTLKSIPSTSIVIKSIFVFAGRYSYIIFDPNVLAIATGISDHDNYAVDFIKTVTWIKANLPYAKISGGISNLSFLIQKFTIPTIHLLTEPKQWI